MAGRFMSFSSRVTIMESSSRFSLRESRAGSLAIGMFEADDRDDFERMNLDQDSLGKFRHVDYSSTWARAIVAYMTSRLRRSEATPKSFRIRSSLLPSLLHVTSPSRKA